MKSVNIVQVDRRRSGAMSFVSPVPDGVRVQDLRFRDKQGDRCPLHWRKVAKLNGVSLFEFDTICESQIGELYENASELRFVPTGICFDERVSRMMRTNLTLSLKPKDLSHNEIELGGVPVAHWHRRSGLRATFEKVVWFDCGLGAHVIFDLRAGEPHVDVTVNLHNGHFPGPGDVEIENLAIRSEGFNVVNSLGDPIQKQREPHPNVLGIPLIAQQPDVSAGVPRTHLIPQRWERPLFFSLVESSEVEQPDDPFAGVGSSEAWFTTEGFINGTIAPQLDPSAMSAWLEREHSIERNRLNNIAASGGSKDPTSPLWMQYGAPYGGQTGGDEIDPYTGVRQLSMPYADGWELLRIKQLRYRCRQPGAIYEPNGEVVNPDAHLEEDGDAPWRMFDSKFQSKWADPKPIVQDQPFDFSSQRVVKEHHADPRGWDPIDGQHFVRTTKENLALAWLTNDPLAKKYVGMDAAMSRMTQWDGTGNAARMEVPSQSGLGESIGRGHAWAAMAIVHAHALGFGSYSNWMERYVRILEVCQMCNGCWSAQHTGKEAEAPPYNGNFWVYRGTQQPKLAAGLFAIMRMSSVDEVDIRVQSQLHLLSSGFQRYLWSYDEEGFPNRGILTTYAAGPFPSKNRYCTRAEVPDEVLLHTSSSFQASTVLGLFGRVGAPYSVRHLRNFVDGGHSLEEMLETMEAWNGKSDVGPLVEQYSPTLAYLQRDASNG